MKDTVRDGVAVGDAVSGVGDGDGVAVIDIGVGEGVMLSSGCVSVNVGWKSIPFGSTGFIRLPFLAHPKTRAKTTTMKIETDKNFLIASSS